MPYGPRPPEQIREFAVEIAGYLVSRDVKMIVVACNSVEVSAIDEVTASTGIPVLGVIDPGVRAALRATRTRKGGGIGTEATLRRSAGRPPSPPWGRSSARSTQRFRLRDPPPKAHRPRFLPRVPRARRRGERLPPAARRLQPVPRPRHGDARVTPEPHLCWRHP